MKYIITFLQRCISRELPKPVGRWRIENCNSQLNRKIDLSNEDHCGPCGQYILEKTEGFGRTRDVAVVFDKARVEKQKLK